LARIAFGILVGQHRALGFQHSARDDVFRSDQLDLMLLTAQFLADGIGEFRVGLGYGIGEKLRKQRGRWGAHEKITSRRATQRELAALIPWREARFQGWEKEADSIGLPLLRMDAQASGSTRFAFPEGYPSLLASRANAATMAQSVADVKRP